MTPEQLVAAYQAQYATTRLEAVARVLAVWRIYGGLSDADSRRFLQGVLPVVRGAQLAVASLVAAYVQELGRQATSRTRPIPVPDRLFTTEALRGTPAAEVYHRPFVTARTAIAAGKTFDEAMEMGAQRTEQIAETDVIMAQRRAMLQAVDADDRIVGWRRTLTGNSCALCATASTQRYHRKNLMPIHVRCDCGVAPIYGQFDPGQVINLDLLMRLQQAGGREYWKRHGLGVDENGVIRRRREVVDEDGRTRAVLEEPLEIAVRQHGEYGQVLVDAADRFTSEEDIAA